MWWFKLQPCSQLSNVFDVVLMQLDRLDKQNDTSFFGPVAGRVAGRIARGRFVLDGKVYHLDINDGRNTLQGDYKLYCPCCLLKVLVINYVYIYLLATLHSICLFIIFIRWRQRIQQSHLDGEGVRRRRRLPVRHPILSQLRRRARYIIQI